MIKGILFIIFRQAAKWYQTKGCGSKSKADVVLITDDVANRRAAQAMDLKAVSLKQYVEGFKDPSVASLLVDRLAAPSSEKKDGLHDNAKVMNTGRCSLISMFCVDKTPCNLVIQSSLKLRSHVHEIT